MGIIGGFTVCVERWDFFCLRVSMIEKPTITISFDADYETFSLTGSEKIIRKLFSGKNSAWDSLIRCITEAAHESCIEHGNTVKENERKANQRRPQ